MLISRSAGLWLAFFIGAAGAGNLVAQEEDRDPAAQPGEPNAAEQGAYARVAAPTVDLRVFPTENSPVYGDAIPEGSGVLIGESYGGYRQVVLPLGPVGYVHKKFATEPEDGHLKTVGANVSFRYRPRSGEAPVQLLPEGTELFVVGEDGDWWKVRFPGGQAWVPRADLQVFEEPSETLIASYEALEKEHRKVIADSEQARRQAAAEARRLAELRSRLDDLRERFLVERATLPTVEQDYVALEAELVVLIEDLPEDSDMLPTAQLLAREIDTHKRIVEATKVILAEPVPASVDTARLAPTVVEDPLARFDAVGWLRHRPSAGGMDRFVVEKGGQTLFWVTCSSERYDLTLFDGVEVGLVGGKDRPAREAMRVVDVNKIEILGLPR